MSYALVGFGFVPGETPSPSTPVDPVPMPASDPSPTEDELKSACALLSDRWYWDDKLHSCQLKPASQISSAKATSSKAETWIFLGLAAIGIGYVLTRKKGRR